MDKITPFLWFNNTAEQAASFYVSIFSQSKIVKVRHWGDGGPAPKGSLMAVDFQIEGRNFIAFNGGPMFQFSPAISLFVDCKTQAEVDHLWNRLTDGGEPQRCGWLRDKFGVSWQIIPTRLGELLFGDDPEKTTRATQAMLKMDKIDIAALDLAAEGA